MELAPTAWIPLGAGVAVVFAVVGWLAHGALVRRRLGELDELTRQLESARSERDEALDRYREEIEATEILRNQIEEQRLTSAETGADEVSFGAEDIIGLEAEIASLRVLAGRARALEARVAELEAGREERLDLAQEATEAPA